MIDAEAGKMIADLRKQAGYTQQSLARELYVTDKAVSKWERGICMPDSSLLTKLSMLLDADIEYLVSGSRPYGENAWVGHLKADGLRDEVAGRPLFHILLSYFLLVGITDIRIDTDPESRDYIRTLDLAKYGIRLSFDIQNAEKVMIVYGRFLLFGANLTRYFLSCMNNEKDMTLTLHKEQVPIVFSHWGIGNTADFNYERADKKPLGRGLMLLPLTGEDEIADASTFIRIYEKYHKKKIADPEEIIKIRGLV